MPNKRTRFRQISLDEFDAASLRVTGRFEQKTPDIFEGWLRVRLGKRKCWLVRTEGNTFELRWSKPKMPKLDDPMEHVEAIEKSVRQLRHHFLQMGMRLS